MRAKKKGARLRKTACRFAKDTKSIRLLPKMLSISRLVRAVLQNLKMIDFQADNGTWSIVECRDVTPYTFKEDGLVDRVIETVWNFKTFE